MHSVRLGVISEIHLAPVGTPNLTWHNELRFDLASELLARAVAWCRQERVDVIAVPGDLTNAADVESFHRVLAMLASAGRPLWLVPGNHDVLKQLGGERQFEQVVAGREDLIAAPARQPLLGSEEIVESGISWNATTGGFEANPPEVATGNALSLLVFLQHFPILSMQDRLTAAGLKHAGDLIDRQNVETALRQQTRPIVALHGHIHVHDAMIADNILQLTSAALIEPPHHVAIVKITVDGETIDVSRRAVSLEPAQVELMPVLAPLEQRWRYQSGRWLELGVST